MFAALQFYAYEVRLEGKSTLMLSYEGAAEMINADAYELGEILLWRGGWQCDNGCCSVRCVFMGKMQ